MSELVGKLAIFMNSYSYYQEDATGGGNRKPKKLGEILKSVANYSGVVIPNLIPAFKIQNKEVNEILDALENFLKRPINP